MLWSIVAQPEVLVVVPQTEVTQIGQAATMSVTNCQVNDGIKKNNTFYCSRCLNTNIQKYSYRKPCSYTVF